VTPRHAKEKVYLQRYSGGAWRTLTWKRLSLKSAFSFRVSPKSTFSYRVYKTSDADHAWGRSPTLRVTVR
jgi:hypothetical protein